MFTKLDNKYTIYVESSGQSYPGTGDVMRSRNLKIC